MNFINIDPMISQMLSQLVNLKSQVNMIQSVDTSKFLTAMVEFSNLLGSELQKQAVVTESTSSTPNPLDYLSSQSVEITSLD